MEHALLVVDDDLGRAEVQQALQPVVPVDDPAVQVIEVRGGKPTTVELHHGAQVGGDDRDGLEDHGPGVVDPATVVVATVEGGDDLQTLDGLLTPLGRQGTTAVLGVDHVAQLDLFRVEVDAVDQFEDVLGPHAAFEVLVVAQAQLTPQHLVFDDLATMEVAKLVQRPLGDLGVVLRPLTNRGDLLFDHPLARLDLGVLGLVGLELLQILLEGLETTIEVEVAPLLNVADLLGHLGFERGQVLVALVVVDPGDQVGGEVDDLLQLLGLELLPGLSTHEQVGQPTAGPAEVPDVHDGRGQLNVAHAVTADLGTGDLDAAALADDALEANPLVLPAVALPVLGRTEDLLAEQAILLGAERPVVDGLGLLDLAIGPTPDGVAGGQADPKLIEGIHVESH